MSISTTTNRVSYAGDGSTTVFPYNFLILANTDLEVIETVTATGVETVKTLTTHYTVSGAGTGSGNVTMVTAPASGTTLTIRRKMPRTQLADYVENDSFPAATHEQALDKLTMIAQELDQSLKRALRQPEGDSVDIDYLPAKSQRASKYLAFDADGDPVASAGTTSSIITTTFTDTLLDDADADQFVDTLVDAMTAETAPAVGDLLVIDDVSANDGRKITLENTLKVVNGLTEDTSPDRANDFVLTYDASASAAKKAKPSNLIPVASQAEVNAMTDTTKTLSANHNKIVAATMQASTSGTSIDFTGIPSGVRRITIEFQGVSLSGIDEIFVQLGDAGGIETTGYLGSYTNIIDASNTGVGQATSGLRVSTNGAAATALHGTIILTLMDSATFRWTGISIMGNSSANTFHTGATSKALSAELDRIRITSTGASTFDAGNINIVYER